MKKTKLFVALASMLALSSAANAYDVMNAGQLTPKPVTATINLAPGVSFTDYLTFSIASPYIEAAGAVMNVPMSFGPVSYNISNLAMSLYSGHLCITCTNELDGSTFLGSAPVVAGYGSMSGLLKTGDYFVKLTGDATGSSGGMLTFTAYAAPVPEPETYAMFMAGLGLMGAIARRRRS